VVANRCKNGNFYWGMANVAPIKEGGHAVAGIVGISLRAFLMHRKDFVGADQ
jgi:hypothetical protein